MNRNIQLLKTQKEKDIKDKEKLKRQVLEKKKECKTLNNRLQEAKVNICFNYYVLNKLFVHNFHLKLNLYM